MDRFYKQLNWHNTVFKPVHFGEVTPKLVIDDFETEPVDVVLLKKRVDDFISKYDISKNFESLFLSPRYFSAIKSEIINEEYKGLKIISDDQHPKNLIYATKKSKYHK